MSTNGGTAAGETYPAEPHLAIIDLPGLEGETFGNSTSVDLHEHVAIAPLVASLHGMTAQDSAELLDRALRSIRKKRPDRSDGITLAVMLLRWAKVNPHGVWDVVAPARKVLAGRGTDSIMRGEHGIDYTGETQPRYTEAALRELNESNRPACEGEGCTLACCNAVTEATLQRETRIAMTGGGSGGGRVRKKQPSSGGGSLGTPNGFDEPTRPAFVGARVSEDVKRALVTERPPDAPTIGELIEATGMAILSGATYADVVAALAQLGRPGDAPASGSAA
jgi:hypothetical protein